MDRPATSRARGICRYYATPRGCFAGDACKFLHGADERLTPYDKAKTCRFYARGHCARGDRCWFRHVLAKVAPDDERIQFSAETCCICLEKPTTYGLLADCSHVFCLECIRQWRAPAGKSRDVVSSGTIKRCPLCRTPSRFITPSEHFFQNDSTRKNETINAYKTSMARVPCKYFDETSRLGDPCCPFGTDCFYKHTNPDGTPHVFRYGARHSMIIYRRHHAGGAHPLSRFDYDDPIEFLQRIFDNPITNLHATLDVIRASLPALVERFASGNGTGSRDSGEDGEILDDFIDPLELLEENLVMHDEAAVRFPTTAGGNNQRPTPPESAAEDAPSWDHMPPLSENGAAVEPHAMPTGSLLSSSQSQSPDLSSQFSTTSRQPFIIDISDDDEDEDEEYSQHTTDPSNSNESSDTSSLESSSITQSSPKQQPTAPRLVASQNSDASLVRPPCEHDLDPPFMTDGRGRVVWSSTRDASGRGPVAEGRGSRHSRTGSTTRIVCPSPSSALLVSNARALGGQDTQSMDGKVGGEGNNEMD